MAEHLAGRYGLPKWQFTLSATQANTEVIRLARELTGREIVVPWNFGVSILEFRGQKIARESIYVTEGWESPEWRAQWRSPP